MIAPFVSVIAGSVDSARKRVKPLRDRPSTRSRGSRARQMFHAIFLAVARDAELELRIAQLRAPAGVATMEGFGVAARLHLETLAARLHVLAMPRLLHELRAEEDQVVRQRKHHRDPIADPAHDKAEEQ